MALPTPIADAHLSDLVNQRIETPDVEYKRWMNLTEAETKAKIAKHICALANYGGGYLVFGFEDDGSVSPSRPDSLDSYDQDVINGIVERYLVPPVHCSVQAIASIDGNLYPVVRVPSHGAQPICAKRDGPHDPKGQPVGIVCGTHYVRTSGPKSVPIDRPELWREVIHRCVLAERGALLTSIDQLFDRPTATVAASAPLNAWLEGLIERWQGLPASGWPVAPDKYRSAFAFRLLANDGKAPQPVDLDHLRRQVRQASAVASDEVYDGAAPFETHHDEQRRPRVAVFGPADGLESLVYPDPGDDVLIPILWRISTDGRGGDVAGYYEDSRWIQGAVEQRSSRKWPPSSKLTPSFQILRVAQLLAFVSQLAAVFPDATRCELVVDYIGLADREIDEPAPGVYISRNYKSAVDHRRIHVETSIDQLTTAREDVTAQLIGPVFRLFDGWNINADAVRAALQRIR